MKSVYYAIWSVILILPVPLKIFVELVLILLLAAFSWLVLKYFLFFISRMILFLNVFILGGIRRIFGIFFHDKQQAYVWDERIGQTGQSIENWMREKGSDITKVKFINILKKRFVIILLVIVYIVAILPVFKIEKFVSSYYVKNIYAVNRMFENLENNLTQEKEHYPPLIDFSKKRKKKKNKEKEENVEEEAPIYLVIKEELMNANLRDDASIDGNSICIISEEDEIIYLNIYESDSERCWLKVIVPTKDNVEGWISERVIRDDILEKLDLQ